VRLLELAKNLVADEHGILRSQGSRSLSYPEDGNAICFAVEDKSFWFRHRNECIVEAVKRFPPDGPILDVGGGNGYVTRRLLDERFEAVLLEPGDVGAYNGKVKRGIPEVICSTLGDANLPDASLHAIGCFDVLEHIESDVSFLRSIQRLLKPGGMLYATVPAHQWLWSMSDVSAGHYRRYSHRSISSALGDGFDLLFFTHFFGALAMPLFLIKSLPFRFGLAKPARTIAKIESEHGANVGVKGGKFALALILLQWFLQRELKMIRQGKSRSLGSSCLFVARKR